MSHKPPPGPEESARASARPGSGHDPGAVLALWNDVDPASIDEYERWHAIEHVPERVWVPGFVAATRYVNDRSDQPRYFTLYEMESLECLESAPYRELVEEPTPWSRAMRPAFRNFFRMTCTLDAQRGAVHGTGILALRAVWTEQADWELPASGLSALAGALMSLDAEECITRVQIGHQQAAGPQALPNQDQAPSGAEYLFLVQTSRLERLERLERLLAGEASSLLSTTIWQQASRYRFASQVWHRDVRQPQRPTPRMDLMK